jgi:hypothetical protein
MSAGTRFPGWLAPWICGAVFGVLGWKSVSIDPGALRQPTGITILAGITAFGFVVGLAFWLRDRRRGR